MKKEEIRLKIGNDLSHLKDKYHIKDIGIFGSTARGEEKNDSDIDLLVEFSEPIGFFDFIRLENYLSSMLGAKVDLISRRALKAAIRKEVLREIIYV